MYIEDEKIQKLDVEYQRIASAVAGAQGQAIEASERLPELKKQFGEVILRAALGEATNADVSAARFAVLTAEHQIEAGDLIVEPARRTQARITGERSKLTRRRGYRQDYENLKSKITAAGIATWGDTSALRDLCLMLTGSHDEADAFLSNLSPRAA